ncbi:hypothetical protein JCM19241_1190 [Vibrio ishigakensis]|uniref:Uncharacterized protein n=1 Tax=Vibrio ishigakensis TaxID=1481914 RepID=A0A0B8QD57_9VIBR|nr:hypothetical protein JCM19241_1190 [Vibrio ishigakensis]
MKKLLLTAAVAVTLVGCNSSSKDKNDPVTPAPVINPENILGTNSIRINEDATVSYMIEEQQIEDNDWVSVMGTPVTAYLAKEEFEQDHYLLVNLIEPSITILEESGVEKENDWYLEVVMDAPELSARALINYYADGSVEVLNTKGESLEQFYSWSEMLIQSEYIKGATVSPITREFGDIAVEGNFFYHSSTEELVLMGIVDTFEEFSPLILGEGPIEPADPIEPIDPTDPAPGEPIKDPEDETPLIQPIIPLKNIHDTTTKVIKRDGSVSVMVDEATQDEFGIDKGNQRFTIYTPSSNLIQKGKLEDYTEPKIDVVDEFGQNQDKWFVNIYINDDGANQTLTYTANGVVRHQQTGQVYGDWEQALQEVGHVEVRTNYNERTGLSSFRVGNFMFRSSDTTEVVEGDWFHFNEYQVAIDK